MIMMPQSHQRRLGDKVASTQETEEPNRECQSKDVEDIYPAGGKKAKNLQQRVKFATEVKEAKDKEAKDYGGKVVQREALIKKAVTERSSFIKANFEIITMAVLRRLLEEDLQLDKFALDPYRKFINQQVDEDQLVARPPKLQVIKRKARLTSSPKPTATGSVVVSAETIKGTSSETAKRLANFMTFVPTPGFKAPRKNDDKI